MKRFKFELDQLLRLKGWKEEEARKALAVEVAALESLKAKLEELRGELAGLYAAGIASAAAGTGRPWTCPCGWESSNMPATWAG